MCYLSSTMWDLHRGRHDIDGRLLRVTSIICVHCWTRCLFAALPLNLLMRFLCFAFAKGLHVYFCVKPLCVCSHSCICELGVTYGLCVIVQVLECFQPLCICGPSCACKIYALLLTNEHGLRFTCALLLRNLSRFNILWGTFVHLKVLTILLEVSRPSAVETCELTCRIGPGLGFVPPLWTSLSVPSSVGMLRHIWLRLGQDTFVLPSGLLIQYICLYHL